MSLSLSDLQSAFKKQETQENRPNNYYPFWSMKVGEQATIRFLPDANEQNPLGFMVEKLMHQLIINGENKSVPCLRMYGEDDCPICKVSSAYYKADDKLQGKRYWRKKQHLVQALIMEDPLPADNESGETHEGKVRIIALGYQLFNIIKETFESGELDEIPYAYENGCDFIIKKTKQGEYDSYAIGSKFARKASDLDPGVVAEIEESLVELHTLLPKAPTYEKVEAMLEADITGDAYEEESTNSESSDAESSDAKAASTKKAGTKKTKPADKKPQNDDEYDAEAADILAKIRNRRKGS